MSNNQREQERNELYRTIWALANELRGSVDGWDFKQYVLGMLFYRYISENLTTYLNKGEWEAGNADFDYIKRSLYWIGDCRNIYVRHIIWNYCKAEEKRNSKCGC